MKEFVRRIPERVVIAPKPDWGKVIAHKCSSSPIPATILQKLDFPIFWGVSVHLAIRKRERSCLLR